MTIIKYSNETAIKPNPGGQERFLNDWEHSIVACEGGWGSGKTFGGGTKLVTLHLFNAFDRFDVPTYATGLVVAPTFGNAMDFDVPELFNRLEQCGVPYVWHGGGTIAGRFSGPAIVLPDFGTKNNPSVILIRSADVAKRITGFQAPHIWCDETARFKEDMFDPMNDPLTQISGRNRFPDAEKRGVIVMTIHTYTNEGDGTKIYREMRNPQMKDGKTDRAVYRIPTSENPMMDDFANRQRSILTPELERQYLGGEAASLSGGRVYPYFEYEKHVDGNLTIRPELPLQVAWDFNIVPGMHAEVGQFHPDADMITTVYEIHGPRMSTQDAMNALILLLTRKIKYDFRRHPLEVFGDSSGQSSWTGTNQTNYDIIASGLKKSGIPYRLLIPKSNPHIADRINAVNCAMIDISGKIHYSMHPRCERLIADFQNMRADKFGRIETTDVKLSHPSSADGYRIYFVRPIRFMSSKETMAQIGV